MTWRRSPLSEHHTESVGLFESATREMAVGQTTSSTTTRSSRPVASANRTARAALLKRELHTMSFDTPDDLRRTESYERATGWDASLVGAPEPIAGDHR